MEIALYSMKTKLLLSGLFLLGFNALAQDSLQLSLRQAERQFVKNNYQLILQQYETDQAQADVITARLFDNPEFSHENLFYNHETKRFLETSMASGQFNTSVSQLIKLAGKRNKNIQLAKAGVKLSTYAYFDLLRSLRYELRSTFYKAYYTQQTLTVYQDQIQAMEQLLASSEKQFLLGNTATKDVIRIKSLLYDLKTEQSDLQNELEDTQSQIKILINSPAAQPLKLIVSPREEESYHLTHLNYTNLLDSAKTNRADLQLAKANLNYAEKSLSLQKANAVPDVALSLSYDLKGNYPEKYTGIGISIPIPLFNRNQGEIKKAKLALAAGNTALQQQELFLENEVYNSYKTALRTENTYQSIDQDFSGDFEQLIAQVHINFRNRNISLIEFLDLYEAYKAHVLQLNKLKYERMNAKEELNYVTGSTLFK